MSRSKSPLATRLTSHAWIAQRRARRIINEDRIKRNVIVLGASAGSIELLIRIFSEIPPDLAAIVGIVLHRGPLPSELLQVLGKRSGIPMIEPLHDSTLAPGRIYLAPPDHHMEFTPRRVIVRRGPKEHSTRPAIDPLFRSAARSFGSRVVGMQLSGGGDDGVSGLMLVKEHSGLSLAQDPHDSEMPYMPMNAIRYDHVDGIMPVKTIVPTLSSLTRGEAVEC
jgi:two-component system chemotaxis response regulator CheB